MVVLSMAQIVRKPKARSAPTKQIKGFKMIIGVPQEVKGDEYRVVAPPVAVEALTKAGHQLLVETTGGDGSGFNDEEDIKARATVVSTAEEVYNRADMIYHVKEPVSSEYSLLKKDQILFSYLHLATNKELTHILMDRLDSDD